MERLRRILASQKHEPFKLQYMRVGPDRLHCGFYVDFLSNKIPHRVCTQTLRFGRECIALRTCKLYMCEAVLLLAANKQPIFHANYLHELHKQFCTSLMP